MRVCRPTILKAIGTRVCITTSAQVAEGTSYAPKTFEPRTFTDMLLGRLVHNIGDSAIRFEKGNFVSSIADYHNIWLCLIKVEGLGLGRRKLKKGKGNAHQKGKNRFNRNLHR